MPMAGSYPELNTLPNFNTRGTMNVTKTNHLSKQKLVLSRETLRWLSLSPTSNAGPTDPEHKPDRLSDKATVCVTCVGSRCHPCAPPARDTGQDCTKQACPGE
jgi:hypothetical protein